MDQLPIEIVNQTQGIGIVESFYREVEHHSLRSDRPTVALQIRQYSLVLKNISQKPIDLVGFGFQSNQGIHHHWQSRKYSPTPFAPQTLLPQRFSAVKDEIPFLKLIIYSDHTIEGDEEWAQDHFRAWNLAKPYLHAAIQHIRHIQSLDFEPAVSELVTYTDSLEEIFDKFRIRDPSLNNRFNTFGEREAFKMSHRSILTILNDRKYHDFREHLESVVASLNRMILRLGGNITDLS